MKKNLIKILGLNKEATDADIYARIGELKALAGEISNQALTTSTPQMHNIEWMHIGENPFHKGPWM